jgi:outer membrane receptor for ferrienterochelin and colicins
VSLSDGASTRADIRLIRSATSLSALVTTATLQPTYVQDSPVQVDVLTAAFLQRNVTSNLMDNISFVPGLNQQVDCGVCFTNSIRINGMEGPYTAVLIDGTPMMSALATVYGLNSADPSLIEQVEIIKGPNSTLYGSEAMGGVINIITKDARFAPRLSLNMYATSNGESNVELGSAQTFGPVAALFSASGAYNQRFVDRNDDNFSDLPLTKRASLFSKWSVGDTPRLHVSGRYYYEDRFGGTSEWTPSDRGSSTVYGESIRTRRTEVLGAYRGAFGGAPFRADVAMNWHEQDSFYGAAPFMATQGVTFGQAMWSPKAGAHQLGLGAAVRNQRYDDSTRFHATHDRRHIPGAFVQDEVALSDAVTLLAGIRVDHHAAHGYIPSPRLALKWTPDAHTTLRVNAATGFRVVSLFTEDHAALTGAREVRIEGRLNPERSINLTAGLNRIATVNGVDDAMTIDVDVFYTRFTNRILPDFGTDRSLIVYRNLEGYAETRGVSLAMGYATVMQPLAGNIGLTFQDAFVVNGGERTPIVFSPRVQGVFTLSYRLPRATGSIDWTGRVLGPIQLPHFDGLPSRSGWFTEQHLQATARMRPGVELYAAVKNVFDYVQRDAIIDPAHPFGNDFDTARVYAPLQGRRVLAGMRYTIGR